jgi:putative iron-dependent peroxidase
MSDEVKPSNSHSALANVGDDLKVIRDNMPFGNMSTNEMGTYFIAYASTFSTVKKMLINMFIGSPAGNYDKLLDFSTPKTGSVFFVPSVSFLKNIASGAPALEVVPGASEARGAIQETGSRSSSLTSSGDGSLSIGSLKKEAGYE